MGPASRVLPYLPHVAFMVATLFASARLAPETITRRRQLSLGAGLPAGQPRRRFWRSVAVIAPWVFAAPAVAFARPGCAPSCPTRSLTCSSSSPSGTCPPYGRLGSRCSLQPRARASVGRRADPTTDRFARVAIVRLPPYAFLPSSRSDASREGRPRAGERGLRARSRLARGRREIWPQLVLSGGPWGERIGPVWNSAFICR